MISIILELSILEHTMFKTSYFTIENKTAAHCPDLYVGCVLDHMYYACYIVLLHLENQKTSRPIEFPSGKCEDSSILEGSFVNPGSRCSHVLPSAVNLWTITESTFAFS